jgi:hypothetical protein
MQSVRKRPAHQSSLKKQCSSSSRQTGRQTGGQARRGTRLDRRHFALGVGIQSPLVEACVIIHVCMCCVYFMCDFVNVHVHVCALCCAPFKTCPYSSKSAFGSLWCGPELPTALAAIPDFTYAGSRRDTDISHTLSSLRRASFKARTCVAVV